MCESWASVEFKVGVEHSDRFIWHTPTTAVGCKPAGGAMLGYDVVIFDSN
jgi:hypothetical protein